LRNNRSRFAGVVIAAALGLSHASAGSIYFTGSGTGDIVYSSWNTPNDFFGFLDAYFDVGASCSGGYCVAASTPGGTPLGNFGLLIGPNYFVSNTGYGELVTLIGTGLYYEELVGFPDGAEGTVSMPNTTAGGLTLLQGNVTGIGIYATPGTTSAAFQFDIINATSQVISGLPSTVYLDIYGTATTVISTSTFNGSDTVFNPFDLDWTATLSDTSLLSSPASSVPEPSTLFLVAAGAACLAAHRLNLYRKTIRFRDRSHNRVQI
jgi:hypothetical protein